MKLDPAPFHHQSARAAATARAYWAHAADGVRLRVGHLSDGPCGTVLLLPGRTEYLEKYGEAAREFLAAQPAAAVIEALDARTDDKE